MKALVVALFTLTLSLGSQAGGVTSGGGYTVVCYYDDAQTQVKSIKLLDFYAAENDIADFRMLPLPEGTDTYDKAIKVIERINHFSPDFVIDWSETINEFNSGSLKFIKRGSITDIDDGATRVSPEKNCFKRQAAVQVKNPAYLQHRLLIDKEIWDRMDEFTKVGLLVHEAIYRSAMEQGHEDAERVRYLTAMLFSTYAEEFGVEQLLRVFKTAKLDGCFNRDLLFVDHETDEVLFKHTVGNEILSYDEETETGKVCDETDIKTGFLGAHATGLLFLNKGTIISKASGGMCFQASKDPSFKGMTLVYTEDLESYYQSACFSTRLVKGLSALRYVGQSSLELSYTPSELIEIRNCELQKVINSEIISCERLSGSVRLLGNTYSLQKFEKLTTGERYTIENRNNYITLFLNGKRIRVRNNFLMMPDRTLQFEVLNAKGVPQVASFNGKECKLGNRDVLVFDQDGSTPKVISPELVADSCAMLFK